MTEVLSQKEIDQLLTAINAGEPDISTDQLASFKIIIDEAMEHLRQSLVADIKKIVREAVKESIAENR
ncbi:hypothetical protein FACS189498_4110 [Spirochaetia bacterium]|nr:hypothetical protein FACS189498_4110 [Spirochaetia bacterium]